jgi:signal peptidase I
MYTKPSDVVVGKPISPSNLPSSRAVRETVESIVIAFILAFLFRTFEAEAFVIPTGSMAPTLQGMHKDVYCTECGFQYRVGASEESAEEMARRNLPPVKVTTGVCPQCRYKRLDLDRESTYSGDRILVNKFAYELHDPVRFDVIVFRFPGDAKMNYIKRLVGLPNETITINDGDLYIGNVKDPNVLPKIARKAPRKLLAMLQDVDDNHYIPKALNDAGFPRRWTYDIPRSDAIKEELTNTAFDARHGNTGTRIEQRWRVDNAGGNEESGIAFQNYVATDDDWSLANKHEKFPARKEFTNDGIRDFYAYNTSESSDNRGRGNAVGDIAIECNVEIEQASGEIMLKIDESGCRFQAAFDIANNAVRLSMQDIDVRPMPFGDDRAGATTVSAPANLTVGKHKLMFANCDDKLYAWLDGTALEFDGPTEYASTANGKTVNGEQNPARISFRGVKALVDQIRVRRDVYYTSLKANEHYWEDLQHGERALVTLPTDGPVSFRTGADQFFALGDNSPASSDGRIWIDQTPGTPHTVDRKLLIGKALFIYWPHGRDDVVPFFPFWPNFSQMKLVR